MRIATLLLASTIIAAPAFAQLSQGTTNQSGVQIQGNTDIKANQNNAAADTKGEGNSAKNTAGAIKGGTQIQGNTNIKANTKNTKATAKGKNNKAANEAGVIGGSDVVQGSQGQSSGKGGQGSSNVGGVQIQGNTDIKAKQDSANAVASGEGNTAKNTTGAIKGGTQIQGNTKIAATSKNTTAVANGKNNTATNEAGVIGGK
jgi:hypothetical protein